MTLLFWSGSTPLGIIRSLDDLPPLVGEENRVVAKILRGRCLRIAALVLPMVATLVGCTALPLQAIEDRSQVENAPLDRDPTPAPRLLSRASTSFCMIVDAYSGTCVAD